MINHDGFNNLEADVLLMEDQGGGSEAMMIHVPNVRQAFLLGGYPQKQSEIHGSIASMDPHVPRLDKWKGLAGRVAYRFYMFDWFPRRGIADVICNWCFFLPQFGRILLNGFFELLFLTYFGMMDI